ncbi:MAG: AAA family ATPase [Vulcanisaeta sp.]
MDYRVLQSIAQSITKEISKVLVNVENEVKIMFAAFLANGHVLVEGFPGLAKTSLVKAFARTLGLSFGRVQFTPDLLPSDITGSLVFNPRVGDFEVRLGPIFANVVLADEINRAPPKVQSALLEAMQEGQVTIGGRSYQLPRPFMVIATQNPIELEGTYPLPEAQLDRFMIRIIMNYPNYDDEVLIVKDTRLGNVDLVNKVVNQQDIVEAMKLVDTVRMDDSIAKYIVSIIRATRNNPKVKLGASPRAAQMLGRLARAWALINGRDYVIPDDVKQLTPYVLNHRIITIGDDPFRIISEILEKVPTPIMAKALGKGYNNE